MKNKTGISFMAIAAGKESTEGASIKRYIGVAPVFVLAVNPNKEELEKLYGIELENNPEYLSIAESGEDKHQVENVRLDFIVKTDAERANNIDFMTKVSIYLRKEFRFNKDKTKCQVIDKYGRTAWVTSEEMKTHAIPKDKNGNFLQVDADYRAAYNGEENLTNFIKAYLNIPNPMSYIKGKWVENTKVNASDCECRLDKIESYFKGDFTELREVIQLQPNNKVKVLFGVKTTDENKQYQASYNEMFLKNNVSDYSRLDKDLQDRKANGAYPTTEFKAVDIQEFNVEPTNFSTPASGNVPFPPVAGSTPW